MDAATDRRTDGSTKWLTKLHKYVVKMETSQGDRNRVLRTSYSVHKGCFGLEKRSNNNNKQNGQRRWNCCWKLLWRWHVRQKYHGTQIVDDADGDDDDDNVHKDDVFYDESDDEDLDNCGGRQRWGTLQGIINNWVLLIPSAARANITLIMF